MNYTGELPKSPKRTPEEIEDRYKRIVELTRQARFARMKRLVDIEREIAALTSEKRQILDELEDQDDV